jgi:hypothetical protein
MWLTLSSNFPVNAPALGPAQRGRVASMVLVETNSVGAPNQPGVTMSTVWWDDTGGGQGALHARARV